MTDLFEEQLSRDLKAHPLPEPTQALDVTSMALGHRIRRRQIGAVVAVVVLLLAIPGLASLWLRTANTDRAPITTPTTSATASPAPRAVILDPVGRDFGPAIEVSTIREGSVHLSSGRTVELPSDQVGTITEFGADAAWLTRSRGRLSLNLRPGPLPITGAIDRVSGVDPGPGGSVMVRTEGGPLIWTRNSQLIQPSQPVLRTSAMAATADALWVTTPEGVTRVDMSDLTKETFPTERRNDWRDVVSANPVANRVVVADRSGCHAVLDGSTAAVVFRTCSWELLALSPDSTLAVARNLQHRTLEIVDLTTGRLRMLIDLEPNPVGPVFVFDHRNRLNLRVGNDDVNYGFMTVDQNGDCWFSAPGPYLTAVHFVTPNFS